MYVLYIYVCIYIYIYIYIHKWSMINDPQHTECSNLTEARWM